jgi:acetyl-CoA acetyltransferase
MSSALLYDATTVTTLLALETYGFCPVGRAWSYVTEEGIGLERPLPVNTNGGLLSEAYVHYANQLLEGVRQCRGTATPTPSARRSSSAGSISPNARPLWPV